MIWFNSLPQIVGYKLRNTCFYSLQAKIHKVQDLPRIATGHSGFAPRMPTGEIAEKRSPSATSSCLRQPGCGPRTLVHLLTVTHMY